MCFGLYLTEVLTVTYFLHHPQTFSSAKRKKLNRFFKAPRGNFKFGGNLTYLSLFLTDNLTMTNS